MSAKRHVAVLLGGCSSEREISLISGTTCAEALEMLGHRVSRIDPQDRDPTGLLAALADRPDAVFNALHGGNGENGRIQAVLDMLRIPYTHSGVMASAIAMHKPTALRLLREAGLKTPRGLMMTFADLSRNPAPLPFPHVVKPAADGSSMRVFIVREPSETPDYPAEWGAEEVLVEEYVPGLELTVAVMGDRPLAVTELRPKQGFYDYRAKYTQGETVHFCPAAISAALKERCLDHALRAHRALGCRGVSRVDFRYDPERDFLATLEVNTQPGMTPLSLVPEQAASLGIDFNALVDWMLEQARWDE